LKKNKKFVIIIPGIVGGSMMPSEFTNASSAYIELKDNQNCAFEVRSKSCKYHATNFALNLVKIIAAFVQSISYFLIPAWSFDIDEWYDKNVYNPIDEKLANNKKLEMIRLGINKIAIPMSTFKS
jgi:hypothetical protein